MAREIGSRDITQILKASQAWMQRCLVGDGSMFTDGVMWNPENIEALRLAFVDHPDNGPDDFLTKLRNQMRPAPMAARLLAAEMLWALLLFPSNLKASTKRQQIRDIWDLSGENWPDGHQALREDTLAGVGSGGPGFNTYRPEELAFLIGLAANFKQKRPVDRVNILQDYDRFMDWMAEVPQEGRRQFRHMIRFFAFPDRVERMSSNNDRRKVLEAFGVTRIKDSHAWSDAQLDASLWELRTKLTESYPGSTLDFYEPPLREQWAKERKIRTLSGEISVTVPEDGDDSVEDDAGIEETAEKVVDPRLSIQIQGRLAAIGAIMGFKIWLPRSDRSRVREHVPEALQRAFLEVLPLNYDDTTLSTIEQIDVLWLRGRSIARAFEVEHTTAVYSGLLRMADLLALQPNMDIRLHIVAPTERREKVFREMLRPVFSLLDRGPLSRSCTFISYESVTAIGGIRHLAHTNDGIIGEFEERAEP